MFPDKDGCTCYDETVRRCPVHSKIPIAEKLARDVLQPVQALIEKLEAENKKMRMVLQTIATAEKQTVKSLQEMATEAYMRYYNGTFKGN